MANDGLNFGVLGRGELSGPTGNQGEGVGIGSPHLWPVTRCVAAPSLCRLPSEKKLRLWKKMSKRSLLQGLLPQLRMSETSFIFNLYLSVPLSGSISVSVAVCVCVSLPPLLRKGRVPEPHSLRLLEVPLSPYSTVGGTEDRAALQTRRN